MSYQDYDIPSFREMTRPFESREREWVDNENEQRMRNVMELRLKELVPSGRTSHTRRSAVIIDGEPVEETLRERLERESRELEVAVTQLTNQLSKRAAQLEHLKRFPLEDPFADGTVLQFEKSFPNTPDTFYSYAAHRVGGRWYLTGERSPQGITWDKFVSWMGLGVEVVYQLNAATRTGRKRVIG